MTDAVRVVVTGASGLLGSALVPALRAAGHEVLELVRRAPTSESEMRWDPAAGQLDAASLGKVDAAVHLAGAGIGDKRWSEDYKRLVRDSRVLGTSLLSRVLADQPHPPAVLLSGSAVGIYGDRGSAVLDESSGPGSGFLAETCMAWEAAADPARAAGIRVVTLRTGIVLDRRGGALGRQLLPFRLGLGATLGSGQQHTSWISLRDWISAVQHLLGADLAGPVNLTSPEPATQHEFAKELGRALHRPVLLRAPRFALRAVLGEFADEGLLASQRVVPAALLSSGFSFADRTLPEALHSALAG